MANPRATGSKTNADPDYLSRFLQREVDEVGEQDKLLQCNRADGKIIPFRLYFQSIINDSGVPNPGVPGTPLSAVLAATCTLK